MFKAPCNFYNSVPTLHNGQFLLKQADIGKVRTGLETKETTVKNTGTQQSRLWSCATTSEGSRTAIEAEQQKKGAWPLPVNFLRLLCP